MHIADSDGQITLQTSTPPTHDIQVESKNGAVELTLPQGSNFQIEADSRHGEVDCDFSGPGLKVVKDGETPSISGSFGKGGPLIRITTEYGAIRLHRAGAHPAEPPEAPDSDEHSGKARTTWNHPKHSYVPVVHVHSAHNGSSPDGLVRIGELVRSISDF